MAEAIVNTRLGKTWTAFSAGTKPVGYVHSKTTAALAEIGIHHSGRSKSVVEFRRQDFDLVVTVCDSAAEECPVWLGPGKRIHRSYHDPAKVTGSEAEITAAFRRLRDDMLKEIPRILE